MLDAQEREGSSRGRLDLLLEQLGIDVVSETLEVEIEALSRFQSGAARWRAACSSPAVLGRQGLPAGGWWSKRPAARGKGF